MMDAWHTLGETLPDAFDAQSALEHGRLANWNIRKAPLIARDDWGTLPVPEKFAVLRDHPVTGDPESLGIVGDRYFILQNEELIGLLDGLIDESGAVFETAGAIDGGRRVFLTMKLPGHFRIGGVDRVDNCIAVMTSHDGTTATSIMVTPVRVACQSVLNVAFGGRSNVFKIRHVRGATARLKSQARQSLDFTFDFLDGFQTEANRMANTELSVPSFRRRIEAAFGAKDTAPPHTRTRRANQLDEMERLFTTSPSTEAVRGTAWAGLAALTEWSDHHSPVRPQGGDATLVRAKNAIMDPAFKNSALELFRA